MQIKRAIFIILITAAPLLADQTITLQEALDRAYQYSPALSAANQEICVKSAEAYQVSRLPNPVASVELDNVGSMGKSCWNSDQENIYAVSQLIELGGKRAARMREAACQQSIAYWISESARLDLGNKVINAFIDVAAAQENAKIASEQCRLTQEVLNTITSQVQAGQATPLQARKAELANTSAQLACQKSSRILDLAKRQLASTWGTSEIDFCSVEFPLFEFNTIPDFCLIFNQLEQNPDLARWSAEICAAQEAVSLEKAGSVPDLVVTAGYVSGDGDGLMLGFEMPIPVFDQNKGNIRRANCQLSQLYDRQKAARVAIELELLTAYDALYIAYQESLAFKNQMLLSAQEAYQAALEGYSQGKYNYLELLDAQRTLFDVQTQYIITLVEFHQKKADLKRLIGLSTDCEL